MSTKKQREVLRLRRMEFDRRVEENRKNMERFVEEKVSTDKGFTVLENMTKQELIAYAYEHDIDVDRTAKKAEILDAVKRESK